MLNGDQAHFFDERIIERNRLGNFIKGDRGEDGEDAKGDVMLCKPPLCIVNNICFERDLGAKFSGDPGMLLNGKARTNLITVDLCEGWGTFFVENITNNPLKFAISIFHGGLFENHANIPYMGNVDEGCD